MIESIYNFKKISSLIATAGQPDEDELHDIAQAGYEVVINLGLHDAEYSIPNEKKILAQYKINYVHLPVSFQAPKLNQYYDFEKILTSISNKKIFIHCAANKRVSVFIALYQVLVMKLPLQEVRENIYSIWQPDDVWEQFISSVISSH
ncbi:MAG: protein tyrosine phosphatase family protein [Gammaproteobacteria bacterium]|nr:protein tyrosine phosphatase family protein [Gammaproteobacteria bacterium]